MGVLSSPGPDAGPDRLGAADCELLRDGLVAQPANTITSAGYVAAGIAVAARGVGQPGRSAEAAAYGTVLGLVGLGSMAYHGPQPTGAGLAHDIPIAVLLGLIPLTAIARIGGRAQVLPGWTPARGIALVGLASLSAAAYAAGRTGTTTCDSRSLLQWHGAWHLLSAGAFAVAGEILFRPAAGGR